MNKSFKEILKMVDSACGDIFYTGRKDIKETVLKCATEIYIEQMKGQKEGEQE